MMSNEAVGVGFPVMPLVVTVAALTAVETNSAGIVNLIFEPI